jgi:alanyl-tRNA synthetase
MSRTADQVRNSFLQFFGKRGHEIVPSSPVVIPNDPTLMFANAGMVQFKDVFTGKEKRAYTRATSSQKCIRISGKHNDLESVGPSPRHHTFFEMLGNFSFGDYFKEEAIVYAWEYIQELNLPKDRLAVTYFGGADGIPADEEARSLWRKVSGLSDDRIIGLGMKDNFWSMGDTGACGPCSEIYFYHGPNPDPSKLTDDQTPDGVGWLEFWNLVFMQFERDASGKLTKLPAPSIDTGMGFERILSALQGKMTNYETDLLRALVDKAAEISGKKYGGTMAPDDVSMRVIADHSRLTAIMLAEGVMPDANGREYVLRRVMRRAIRHGHRLGIARPFFHEVTLKVVDLMGSQYPELRERADHIAAVTEQEEVRFRRRIERGLSLLDDSFIALDAQKTKVLDGRDAFKLYDTYGFPLDLTQVICSERGFEVDVSGYDAALTEARERSEFKGVESAVEEVYREALTLVPGKQVQFFGYKQDESVAKLVAIIADGQLVSFLDVASGAKENVELVFEHTPFYGESGGQVGDGGKITGGGVSFTVSDTQKPIDGLYTHRGSLLQGKLTLGATLTLSVDVARRNATRRNHSATHLLHWALRQVLGSHAQQKGSLVGPERLRFDFTHGKSVTEAELRQIEDLVNERILLNVPVETAEVGIEEAKTKGAMMLFGEKYGQQVRVLSMAESVELCGGIHAKATGDIGFLKITGEQGVAAGVRRISAITGHGAFAYVRELEQTLDRSAALLKTNGAELPVRLERLIAQEKALEKQIAELQRKLLTGQGGGIDSLLAQAKQIAGVSVLAVRTEITERGALRELAEQLRDKLGDAIVLVGSVVEDKAQLVLTVSKSLTGKYKAGALIGPLAAIVGGSGGGRPDMAQAGGTDHSRLDEALAALGKQLA